MGFPLNHERRGQAVYLSGEDSEAEVIERVRRMTGGEAVARHRENTGHGGMRVLRFVPGNKRAAASAWSSLGSRRKGNDGARRQTKNGSMVIQTRARTDQACRSVALTRNHCQSYGAANSHNSQEGGPVGHFDQTAAALTSGEVDWSRPFEDPISLPNGRQLVTLKDAADYIMELPKAEQDLEEWQTAIGCLIGAAEGRDFMMHARIGGCAL
jgi:hypothetical protein